MIRRNLVVGVMPSEFITRIPAQSIQERKLQALAFICDNGENVVNRAMAIFEYKKELTDKAYECMDIRILQPTFR